MIVRTKELRSQLKKVALLIDKKPIVQIMEGVKIENNTLTASNLSMSVTVPVELDLAGVILDYSVLSAALEKMDADEIEITKTPTGAVLKSGRASIKIPASGELKEWPNIKPDKGAPVCVLSREDIERIAGLGAFVGNDDLRPAMKNICYDGMSFAATNGHILGVYNIEGEQKKKTVLPLKLFYALNLYPTATEFVFKDGTVTVLDGEKQLSEVKYRSIDEAFPDWRNVIPNYQANAVAAFELEEMTKAIDILNLGTNEVTNKSNYNFSKNGGIIAKSEDVDLNREAEASITSENNNLKADQEHNFNNKLLIKCLKYLDGEIIKMFLPASGHCIVMESDTHKGLTLIMGVL